MWTPLVGRGRPDGPRSQHTDRVAQPRRVEHLKLPREQREIARDVTQRVGTGPHDARRGRLLLHLSDRRSDAIPEHGCRDQHADRRVEGVGGPADPARHEVDGVGSLARRVLPGRHMQIAHPVEAEDAPVAPIPVPRHEVPAARGRDEPMRLDGSGPGVVGTGTPIGEPQLHRVAARPRHRGERRRIHRRRPSADRHRRHTDGVDALAQSLRHDLVELGECPHRLFLDAGHGSSGGEAEADGDGHRLLVVEHERGHGLAGRKPVAASQSPLGVHRIAEFAQPGDIPAHTADADIEPFRELGARPHGVLLQQCEQPQEPDGRISRVGHVPSVPAIADPYRPLCRT